MLKRLLAVVRWLKQPSVNDRVVLIENVAIFDLGVFPKGLTGTVTWTAHLPDPSQPVGAVRLDRVFPELALWQNELQVWPRDSCGEVTWDAFARLPKI